MSLITIVLADDHQIVRQGFKALLENQPEFSVIAEASDGLSAVQIVTKLKPRVLLVDVMMPGLNGLEVTRQVRKLSPDTKVIILSMHMNEPYVIDGLQNGAHGYVLKESSIGDLVKAIHEVIAGRHYLSPPLSEHAVEAYLEKTKGSSMDLYYTLTTREREVLQLIVQGKSNAEIATKLFISQRTAEMHRGNMMKKLDLHSQIDLVKYALSKGLIPS
ncbi:MAG: Oxygen regulatory protein NreC [Syntrophorhabdus sp. PtaU1.Bin153]|nr:MAG: Oxygen regulatory protein NreC [Syntrophorhabdus sp. PtaU1.Bin153]